MRQLEAYGLVQIRLEILERLAGAGEDQIETDARKDAFSSDF
jgi:hypothetical protein